MKSLLRISVLALLVASITGGAFALPRSKDTGKAWKPTVFEWKQLDGNTINCTVASDGPYADNRRTSASGLEWPQGTGKTAIFTAGIWLVGKHSPTNQLRTAQMDYGSEYQAGPLLETFNTTTNDDDGPISRAGDARYRLYKIQKNRPDGDAERQVDAWSDWPGDLGAPYVDVDANGAWTPGTDIPEFRGDQMIWCVINDVNNALHTALGATRPMGVEIQTTYFVFNQPGALGNIMFMKWRVINKSDASYDSVYIGMWSDPDLGDAGDDLPGVDVNLSLGYIYNGDNNDEGNTGYGTKPPAVGFDFFQGPIVPGAPTDSALFEEKWRYGFRNLPATAHVVYCNATFAQLQDPPDGDPDYALQAWDYLQGKAGTIHQYVIKSNGDTVRFFFSGDPVTGTGDLPNNFPLGTFAPQDIRTMLASGPFTLAQGDTQEIVGSIILAQGADRLASITALRQYDQVAQQAFNDNFNVPSAPPLPDIQVSELPNQIVFDWSVKSEITETYTFLNPVYNYRFEGYNFYQGETPQGPWKRLATFDKVNDTTLIEDRVQDPQTGNFYLQPVQYGTDSGIERRFIVDKDYITNEPLVNGKPYYFALTTYAVNGRPDAADVGLVLSLEAAKDVLTVVPTGIPPGSTVPTAAGATLPHSRGYDAAVVPEIVSPLSLTGLTYDVVPNGTGSTITSFDVVRNNASGTKDTVVRQSTNLTGDNSSPIVDGIMFRVPNVPPNVRADNAVPPGVVYTPNTNVWVRGAGAAGFDAFGDGVVFPRVGKNLGPILGASSEGSKVPNHMIKKVEIRFSNTVKQKAYRYLGNVTTFPPVPPADSSFLPYILRKGPGFVYQGDYNNVTVPFTVWEVDSLDGDPTPRQLNCGFLEYNGRVTDSTGAYVGAGAIDGQWMPTRGATGGTEALYIFASTYADTVARLYTTNPSNPAQPINFFTSQESLDVYYIVHLRADSGRTFTDGDIMAIRPNYPLGAGRVFSVVAGPVATSGDVELAKSQIELINVVPNPYFAHNPLEAGAFNRFVTFTNLPRTALIRVYTLTGELVRTIEKDGASTFQQWDLRNTNGLPVASGMYVVHIEIPDVGNRILKLAIIQPEERPARI